jgi:segregation and condensation protein A
MTISSFRGVYRTFLKMVNNYFNMEGDIKEEAEEGLNKDTADIKRMPETLGEHPQQIQVYDIINKDDPGWQTIIYDLINSEQLDPWNIDISTLCRAYLKKIHELQESDFFVSSKVLLAAALLLRIKSDLLLTKYIREIDNILFKKEEKIDKILERIEIDEDLIPYLSPKTPMPRFKQVTLQELISALDVAIKTEGRRIQKEIEKKQAERLSYVDIPKFRRINIKDRIKSFYAKVLTTFKNKKGESRLAYSYFTGPSREEKIACFLPMLHLSNNNKLWIEQEGHYAEIYLYLLEVFRKTHPDFDKAMIEGDFNSAVNDLPNPDLLEEIKEQVIGDIAKEVESLQLDVGSKHDLASLDEMEKEEHAKKINKDFENPIGDLFDTEAEKSEDSK